MKLVLLGPPGAGKGTLAQMLKEALNLVHISTGDILREEIKQESDLGKMAQQCIEKGALVPDDVITKIIENKFKSDSSLDGGYMLDGFPRTRQQAEELDRILQETGKGLDITLYMEATLPVILKRLTGRRVCRNCGTVYHLTNRPPKQEGVCDVCQSTDLYQRSDDNEETIRKRMDVYIENTRPILDFYRDVGNLQMVDGDDETELIRDKLLKQWS